MERSVCPVCEGARFVPVPGCNWGSHHLERCVDCGHMVTRPEPGPEALPSLYGSSYYGPGHRRFCGALEAATAAFRRGRARAIARRRAPGAALDIGCGRGLLLDALRRRGWSVVGTELTDEAGAHARDVLGLPIATGEFTRLALPETAFDVVILWQSFEHMRGPRLVLQRAYEVLRPGGWIIVSVPNRESWQARVAGRYWFHLDVPRHLHHYGLSGLRRLLSDAGFRVFRVSHFNWEQNPFGWLQSLLNALTGTPSGLFDALRGVRPVRRVGAVAGFAGLPLLVPLAFGLALAESVARRGGTVTVWAAKDERGPS